MDTQKRRQAILEALKASTQPITANELALKHQVTRQVIVGDIAILRAAAHDILATNSGYLMNVATAIPPAYYTGKIVCQHNYEQTQEELAIIVRHGGQVVDVQVDHPFYGLLTASLKISTQEDIRHFIQRMEAFNGELLSSLTQGIHIHTLTTPSIVEFNAIKTALDQAHILYPAE